MSSPAFLQTSVADQRKRGVERTGTVLHRRIRGCAARVSNVSSSSRTPRGKELAPWFLVPPASALKRPRLRRPDVTRCRDQHACNRQRIQSLICSRTPPCHGPIRRPSPVAAWCDRCAAPRPESSPARASRSAASSAAKFAAECHQSGTPAITAHESAQRGVSTAPFANGVMRITADSRKFRHVFSSMTTVSIPSKCAKEELWRCR